MQSFFKVEKINKVPKKDELLKSLAETVSIGDNEKSKKLLDTFCMDSFRIGVNNSTLIKNLKEIEKEISNKFKICNVVNCNNLNNYVSGKRIDYSVKICLDEEEKGNKEEALEEILDLTEDFIVNVIKHENMGRVDDDLRAAGRIGVLNSISKDYDPEKGKFLTYAYPRIRNFVQKEKRMSQGIIRYPRHHELIYHDFLKVIAENNLDIGVSEDVDNGIKIVKEKLSKSNIAIKEDTIKDVINIRIGKGHVSLDNEYDDDLTLHDSLGDDFSDQVIIDKLYQKENIEKVKEWVNCHTDFERMVLENRFGIDLGKPESIQGYEVKCLINGKEVTKTIPGIKAEYALNKARELGYEILSSHREVANSPCNIQVRDSTIETLKDYLEIKKSTPTTIQRLGVIEGEIINSLQSYLGNIVEGGEKTKIDLSI